MGETARMRRERKFGAGCKNPAVGEKWSFIAAKISLNRLLKNACVDPLVLRDAMLCIAHRHK
jgi:hypothetical protein